MISKIYSIDGKCIWMDAEFYSKDENAVPNPEATYTDAFPINTVNFANHDLTSQC